MKLLLKTAFILSVLGAPAIADQPKIEAVTAHQTNSGWVFNVTILHPDSGWDHYADGWSVNAPDGTQLGIRTLAHPHEIEQPFTRSLSGVKIPDGITNVTIRARDNVDGWFDETYPVTLK